MSSITGLARSLLALQKEKRSGVVTVRAEGVVTFVYLREGVMVFAEEGSHGETLGRLLVRQRRITQEQYVEIIGAMTDALVINEQLRFGEVAVELGYLGEDEVRGALLDQIRWKVVRVFQRPEATWEFEESLARLDDVGNFPMQLEALLLEALRWVDDDTKMDLGLAVGLDRPLRIEPAHAVDLAERFGLTPAEEGLAARVDGRLSIRELLALKNDNHVDVHAVLTALIMARVARVAPPDGAPLARPATPFEMIPVGPRVPAAAAPSAAAVAPLARPATPLEMIPLGPRAAGAAPAPAAGARRAMPVARTSRILQALEVQRRKAEAPRDPTSDHEARLLAESALQSGLTHMKAGRHGQAGQDLQRALDLQPKSSEYRLYVKWCALRARGELPHPAELGELRRLAMAALAADPNFAFGYYVSGDLALGEGRDREALRVLRRATKLDPDLLDAQRLLRVVERRLGPGGT